MPPPKTAIKQVQTWLKQIFGKEFKNTSDSLQHGKQDNFTDCGILAANTAAHNIFGDDIWTNEIKSLARVEWFRILGISHIKDVRTRSDFTKGVC